MLETEEAGRNVYEPTFSTFVAFPEKSGFDGLRTGIRIHGFYGSVDVF